MLKDSTKTTMDFHDTMFTRYSVKENQYRKINAKLRNDASFIDEAWNISFNLRLNK
jgi:hypothetical protein